ncbi:hypothetical protein MKW92_009636 [Papaver armeniacum]|nr:hypothetical protein MKW92_009636 [Papaver armeniacum]
MMAKITLLENDVACLKQRNDEEAPFEGDYHDEDISHRSVSRNLCADTEFSKEDVGFHTPSRCRNFILDDFDMGGENDKEGTKQHGADVASNDVTQEEKKECIANLKYPATPVMMMT